MNTHETRGHAPALQTRRWGSEKDAVGAAGTNRIGTPAAKEQAAETQAQQRQRRRFGHDVQVEAAAALGHDKLQASHAVLERTGVDGERIGAEAVDSIGPDDLERIALSERAAGRARVPGQRVQRDDLDAKRVPRGGRDDEVRSDVQQVPIGPGRRAVQIVHLPLVGCAAAQPAEIAGQRQGELELSEGRVDAPPPGKRYPLLQRCAPADLKPNVRGVGGRSGVFMQQAQRK